MTRLHLFEALGLEIELMIVDRESLDVRPICDRLLEAAGGEVSSEVERGELAWCNELALHVIELKTAGPTRDVPRALDAFRRDVVELDRLLADLGARALPTAMHPWMDPDRETRLWPHEYGPVYRAYDRIFDCRGHGWSNLQSVHLNLPFAGDEEFGRLHAAIRLVLPLLPALAASSPFVEGRATGILDNRMAFYRTNSRRIPSVAGAVVPEPIFTEAEYRREIFERIYRDIEPHDPEGVLRDEFLNSRGAIARFERGSIEIRVLDSQECPRADLALGALIVGVLRWLVAEAPATLARQQSVPTAELATILDATVRDGERARIENGALLGVLGLDEPTDAGELWPRLRTAAHEFGSLDEATWGTTLDALLRNGPLARRLLRATGEGPSRERLREVFAELGDCLVEDRLFGV